MIIVDSVEYKSWHEAGHATVCLHLGGHVEFMEFLARGAQGHARTRCVVTADIDRSVACAGFAAEFYLLKNGYAEPAPGDERDISRIVFHNATDDREDFWQRKLGEDDSFTKEEDTQFMHHAIGLDGHGGLTPTIAEYFPGMQMLVRELSEARRVEGKRVKELLTRGRGGAQRK